MYSLSNIDVKFLIRTSVLDLEFREDREVLDILRATELYITPLQFLTLLGNPKEKVTDYTASELEFFAALNELLGLLEQVNRPSALPLLERLREVSPLLVVRGDEADSR